MRFTTKTTKDTIGKTKKTRKPKKQGKANFRVIREVWGQELHDQYLRQEAMVSITAGTKGNNSVIGGNLNTKEQRARREKGNPYRVVHARGGGDIWLVGNGKKQ